MTELKIKATIKKIRTDAQSGNIRITRHALQEMAEESIGLDEVLESIAVGKVLEYYPKHRRGSCCLLYGKTRLGKPLHIVCTTDLPVLIVITTYRPQLPKWISPTERRKKDGM